MAKKVKKTENKEPIKKATKKAALQNKSAAKAVLPTAPKKTAIKTKSTNTSSSQSAPSKTAPKAAQGSDKTYLTPTELEYFKRILLEKLKELVGDVDSIENEALGKNQIDATGNLSTMPIHMADLGSDTFEQDFALGLMSSERKIVTEILAALKRIKEGTYGICEGTGKPIPKIRLEASPWARYCVEYASKIEKGTASLREQPRRWKAEAEKEPDEDEVEEVEEKEEEVEDADKEFDVLEVDPDLDDLYEIEDVDESPGKE